MLTSYRYSVQYAPSSSLCKRKSPQTSSSSSAQEESSGSYQSGESLLRSTSPSSLCFLRHLFMPLPSFGMVSSLILPIFFALFSEVKSSHDAISVTERVIFSTSISSSSLLCSISTLFNKPRFSSLSSYSSFLRIFSNIS